MSNVTVGELPQLHGHWADRLAAIDRDIAAVAEKLEATKPTPTSTSVSLIINKVLGRNERSTLNAQHFVAEAICSGQPLTIELKLNQPTAWANSTTGG
jgi:hypothetical protein